MTRIGLILLLCLLLSAFANSCLYDACYKMGLHHSQPSAVVGDCRK